MITELQMSVTSTLSWASVFILQLNDFQMMFLKSISTLVRQCNSKTALSHVSHTVDYFQESWTVA